MHGGIKPGIDHDFGDHGSGGGFAVRAADVDGMAIALHELPQQRCALHLGDAQLLGAHAFGVVLRDGGGIDDEIRAIHIFRALADEHVNARLLQRVGSYRSRAESEPVTRNAELEQHAGQTAHRAAADARSCARVCPYNL